MKSLKGKLIFIVLILVIVSSLLTVTIGLIQSFKITESITQTQFENELTGANNMLRLYLQEQFGELSLSEDGKLVDQEGKYINERYDYMDQLSESMNVVATVFAKDGSDYIRILTTITDNNGDRVVGTKLDPSGEAYRQISQGTS